MRLSTRQLGLLLLGLSVLPAPGRAQSPTHLREVDRVRLAETRRLAHELSEKLWPGWSGSAAPLLLVTDSTEFLVGQPRPTADFTRSGTTRC